MTRPSGTITLPGTDPLITQEVAEIGVRGRFHILPRWTKRTGWRPNTDGIFEMLVILGTPGKLLLRHWEPDGPKIVSRFNELQAMTDPDQEALRLIQDTYGHLAIPKDNRVHLGDVILQHLGLPTDRTVKANVYVAIWPARIDIMSPLYRNQLHIAGHTALDDLPM